ncbi:MAG: flagellar biosynthetic protein FliO [Planctomycetia bacterium]
MIFPVWPLTGVKNRLRACAVAVAFCAAMPTAACGDDAIPIAPAPPAARSIEPVAFVPMETAAATGRPTAPALVDWKILGLLAAGFAAVVALRLFGKRREPTLPPDVFDVLGTASLGGPHSVRIVRFGPKTLLVSVSASGCQTLCELSDPQATACIAAACKGVQPPLRPQSVRPCGPRTVAGPRVVASALLIAATLAAPTVAADPPAADGTAVAAPPPAPAAAPATASGAGSLGRLAGTRSLDTSLSAALMFGVASLAPAVLLMTTSFVRMSVVLSLVRQGLGTQQLPSNQIVTSLAIFLSAMVMWPVWTQAYRDGVEPYQRGAIELPEAYARGTLPIRRWMAGQIEQAGNRDTMLLFLSRHPAAPKEIKTYDDVPVESLLPAFLVSELETAFAIGFRLLLPFLVVDLLVATLVVSTGLVMLPPTLVSLPLKLLVFVMADGWSLVVRTLLDSMLPTAS